ncbi:MAG: hypothetical protein ACI4UH_03960 [Dorea sp.]
MKSIQKITAIFLAALMLITVLPMPVFAAEPNTAKEEVVYINLNADGSVKEINVVNIFALDKDGKIIDYGEYTELRNMTTTDSIGYKDHTVTVDTKAGKLYYEGKLKESIIPWNINIRYYMDGKEYTAKEIAGKSGKLEIKLSIKKNADCHSSFFEGYALQATVTLNTELADNVVADGATIANVGKNKQLTYTILPNTEKDISVVADVKDFEMNAISINGIQMNLDMDIDDAVISDKIDEIIGAVGDLNDGAGELDNGAKDLHSAMGELNTAVRNLHSGVGSLYDGASDLKSGLDLLVSKNTELTGAAWTAYEGLCTAAETQLNAQLAANGLGTVTLTPTTYEDILLGVLKQMNADSVYKKAYNAALKEVTAQVEAQADTLYTEYIQSQADAAYLAYVQSQTDTLYTQVAYQAVLEQLISNGMGQQQAEVYLQTPEGQALVTDAVENMTDQQKKQIINTAVTSLSPEQKEQILQGALTSLTDKQKEEIRNGYIQQMMASEDVTKQINSAVAKANSAAIQVSELKGQLDNYGAFYNGLVEYTNAVSSAVGGASQLTTGLRTLYSNTETLKSAVGELHIAVGTLEEGTDELKGGTQEFADKTVDMDTEVSDEIDSVVSSLTGSDVEIKSFVSDKNTNIKSVQFVIQTEAIEIDDSSENVVVEEEHLNFWQKFLRLFRLY